MVLSGRRMDQWPRDQGSEAVALAIRFAYHRCWNSDLLTHFTWATQMREFAQKKKHYADEGFWGTISNKQKSGVFKGGFLWGGEISIIGVVRAPVAIINFAGAPYWILCKLRDFDRDWREINCCNRGAHDPNYWDFPPHKNPPLETPQAKMTFHRSVLGSWSLLALSGSKSLESIVVSGGPNALENTTARGPSETVDHARVWG